MTSKLEGAALARKLTTDLKLQMNSLFAIVFILVGLSTKNVR